MCAGLGEAKTQGCGQLRVVAVPADLSSSLFLGYVGVKGLPGGQAGTQPCGGQPVVHDSDLGISAS